MPPVRHDRHVFRSQKAKASQRRRRTPQRNASSFARSRRRSTHNSAVLRAYGAGGDGETSGANHASESIGNQEPLRHESSLLQAADMAADGMPSCATQVRESSVGMVFSCAVKRLLVMNIFRPRLRGYLPLPFFVSHRSSDPCQNICAEDSSTFGPACPGFQEHAAVIGAVQGPAAATRSNLSTQPSK